MNILVQRLQTMLGPPEHTDDVPGYLAGLMKVTDHFGPAALDKAADTLLASAGRKWPTPKDIVDACVDAQDVLASAESRRPRKDRPKMPWETHAELARHWAVHFCQCAPLAKQAFDEGWGKHLFVYAQSFAREAYRRNTAPDPLQLSVSDDWLRYHRGSADLSVRRDDLVREGFALRGHVTPRGMRDLERASLLGEPFAPETDARLAAKSAAMKRGGDIGALLTLKTMPIEEDDAA